MFPSVQCRVVLTLGCAIALTGCGSDDGIPGHEELTQQVARERVGVGADQWIEMSSAAGGWERTGLIFGYVDDRIECLKAIEGLSRQNPAREYRCTPAN
jgi:hypothetical protein